MNIKKFIPILDWLPNYKKSHLTGDLSAGLTVGVMLIPQGMAYAMIAGLPPVYGLYAAIVPQLVYAIFGTSRQLAVGPVAMDSLLVAAGVSGLAAIDSPNYISLAIALSLMMGVVQVAFGVLKMGFLVNFLSKPVISGFTSAAALIIGLNQLKHIVGVDLERGNNIFLIIEEAFLKYSFINWLTVFIGVLGIILIILLKKIHKSIPGALIVVIIGVVIVKVLGLNELGVAIVGHVPEGLPGLSVPDLSFDDFEALTPVALTLALIAFMESISVAKAIESRHKGEYEIDNNQEMIGLGMANVVGSFFACYPTTGGFSRSAVSDQSGAKTNLAAIIAAIIVAVILLFFTAQFYYLPKAVLGSIVIVAVFGLIDFKYPVFLWKTKKQDFFMLLVAFGVTLGLGIKEGIGAGVVVSLIMLVYRTTQPHIATLGRLPGTRDFRNVERFSEIEERYDVLVMRHDAQLYFANISNFVTTVKKEIELKKEVKFFVLHCGSVSSIDATALQALKELVVEMQESNIQVAFSGLIGPVRDFLFKSNFIQELGEKHFFTDVHTAIECFDNCSEDEYKRAFKNALQTNVFKEKDV